MQAKFQICVRVYTFTTYIVLYIDILYDTKNISIQSKHPRAFSKSDVEEDANNRDTI